MDALREQLDQLGAVNAAAEAKLKHHVPELTALRQELDRQRDARSAAEAETALARAAVAEGTAAAEHQVRFQPCSS